MGAFNLQNQGRPSRDPVLQLLAEGLAARCGVKAGQAVVVAVSGGIDSMALVEGMVRLPNANPAGIIVAHVNHRLRGDQSDADERFVMQASAALGVRCVSTRVDVSRKRASVGESLEMACRRLRHAALAEMCREVGIDCLCLAHTADDQVEHFLLRLLRGAGSAGLRGMAWVGPSPADPGIRLLRPLLAARRSQLLAFLQRTGAGFREDASNSDLTIPRNRVRHELLPMLRQFAGPSVDQMIRQSMDLLGAEGELAEGMAAAWREDSPCQPFDSQSIAVQRIAIRNQLIDLGIRPEFRAIEVLRLPGKQRVAASGGRWVEKTEHGRLRLVTEEPGPEASMNPYRSARVLPTTQQGCIELPGRAQIRWRRFEGVPAPIGDHNHEAFVDAGSLEGGFAFRHWLPGDRIQSLGMQGRSKLQDLFVNRKLPKARRRELWIGEDSAGEVFWIEGFPPSERHKVRIDSKAVIGIRCVRSDPMA